MAAGSVLLLALAPGYSATDPLAEVLAQAATDFISVKQAVQAVQQRLGEVDRALEASAGTVVAMPAGDEWRRRAGELRASLKRRTALLASFADRAGRVAQPVDAAEPIAELRDELRAAGFIDQLRAFVADSPGGTMDAARVDAAAAAFVAARLDLMAVLDRLQKQIDIVRDQSELRSALYGGDDDPRYQQLVAQYGSAFANASAYRPSTPREVFRPTSADKAVEVVLIWDEPEGEWYRLKGDLPLEKIFEDAYAGLGRRPTPGQLKFFADNFAQVKTREATAAAVAQYLAVLPEQPAASEAWAKVEDAAKITAVLGDPQMFRKKFVYDGPFRGQTLDVLDKLRRGLRQQGTDRAVRELDAMVAGHGITLESQWDEGVVPATATVRVVAWFSDKPQTKFNSVWRFEKEKVTIDIDNGHGSGVRRGNVVRSEGSLPAHNCTATDVRTFLPGGKLAFDAVYTCAVDDGATRVENVSGAGTWEIVAPRPLRGRAKR